MRPQGVFSWCGTRFVWIVLLLLVFFPYTGQAAEILDRVIAIVNKEVITWSDLYRAMEFEISSEMRSLSNTEKMKLFRENEAVFLESMIDKKLQMQAARRLNIDASNEEINEAIENIKKKYSINESAFQDALKKEGFTLDEYRKRLADQIILSKVVGQQVRSRIIISDEEIQENIIRGKELGYRIRQIFFKKSEKEGELKSAEERASEALRKIKAGEDFGLVALKYSEDPTAKMGGDLGFIKKEDMGKELLTVVSSLRVGQVSDPFWTNQGLHIIKLEEKMDSSNITELKELVQKKLFEKKFAEEYKSWIRALRERSYVEVRL